MNPSELAERATAYATAARARSAAPVAPPAVEWWRVTLALTDEQFEVFFHPPATPAEVAHLYPGATIAAMDGPT